MNHVHFSFFVRKNRLWYEWSSDMRCWGHSHLLTKGHWTKQDRRRCILNSLRPNLPSERWDQTCWKPAPIGSLLQPPPPSSFTRNYKYFSRVWKHLGPYRHSDSIVLITTACLFRPVTPDSMCDVYPVNTQKSGCSVNILKIQKQCFIQHDSG